MDVAAISGTERCDSHPSQDNSAIPTQSLFDPNDVKASCNGAGTLEIRDVVQVLKSAGIPSCLVGISALIYFGAPRIRLDWEICVPTEMFQQASRLFESPPYDQEYSRFSPVPLYPGSLYHTFPRYKVKGIRVWFILVPSEDAYIDCKPSNFEWSRMGLPYAKLDVFAQSLLATHDMVALTDLVDAMNLNEQWGEDHLNLNGTSDEAWAERKDKQIIASIPSSNKMRVLYGCSVGAWDSRDIWQDVVRTKTRRIGPEFDSFQGMLTRFRCENDKDPRFEDRQNA